MIPPSSKNTFYRKTFQQPRASDLICLSQTSERRGHVALSAQNIFITLDKFGSFTIGRHITYAIKLDIHHLL